MDTFFIGATTAVVVIFIAYKLGAAFQRRKDRAAYIPPIAASRPGGAKDYYDTDKR